MPSFDSLKQQAAVQLRESQGQVRLKKGLSHLFRGRERPAGSLLDPSGLDGVLDVDPAAGTFNVGAMISYQALVDATLEHGLLPAVVPQLKGITLGGACAGLGIESSSFRYGLSHETVEELEVLLADGSIILCTPDNEHSDLFFAFPNSFGTLGYALRVKARALPAKRFVALTHTHYAAPEEFFRALDDTCRRSDVDFVDGVVFGPGDHYLTVGRFVDEAPYTSDYTYRNIYYRSIRERQNDYLTTFDYIWRWDTDWFWCSRVLGAQNPIVRRLLGRDRLNSIFYKKLIDWQPGIVAREALWKFRKAHIESVIQDVDVTVDKAPAFLDFFQREVGLTPVWICPFRRHDPEHRYPLFPTDAHALYVNFGFWDQKSTPDAHPPGHFNRLIERKLDELGGIKSLYSDSFFDEEAFWATYGGAEYRRLKAKYDPDGRLSDIYRKCVLRE